jgi:hypothetical protein
MKRILGVHAAVVVAIMTLAVSAWAVENGKFQIVPSAYNPGKATVRITAAWVPYVGLPDIGAPDNELILAISDTVPYPPGASARALVNPVKEHKVTHLAFDHKIDTYCTNGSPRWDVETTDESVYAFGCASGIHQVNLPTPGWERITFTCTDVQVLNGPAGSCPLGTGQSLSLLQVLQDESGSTTLANLDVNHVMMGKPGNNR